MKVGIDILEIERIKNLSQDDIKLGTLFTANEIKYFRKYAEPMPHIAGHFCAKEAIVKAFGTGFDANIKPLNIEIKHNEKGAPYAVFFEGAQAYVESNGYHNISISISHDKHSATAICVIE